MDDPRLVVPLRERLRRDPSPSSVAGSLPVLFFGDIVTAKIATIGLNPSDQEYLDKAGNELSGSERRFETLASLGAPDRLCLTDEQCTKAITRMQMYFRPGKPVYSWFRALDRVTKGLGLRYDLGEAVHLDLVQEATKPTWSELPSQELVALRRADEPFLRWQLEAFPMDVVVCNGRTVFEGVRRLVNAETVESGRFDKLVLYFAVARLSIKTVAITGWNIPLARPTGLTSEEQVTLGQHLAEWLKVRSRGAPGPG